MKLVSSEFINLILNSSFYQRYLGSRDTLRVAYIDQALALPKQVHSAEQFA